jgi:hypothetical protein
MRESKKGKYPIDSGWSLTPDLRGRAGTLGPSRAFHLRKGKEKNRRKFMVVFLAVCGVLSGLVCYFVGDLCASLRYSKSEFPAPRSIH